MKKDELIDRLTNEVVSAEIRGDAVSAEFWQRTLERAIRDDNRIPTYYSEALGHYVTIPE